MKKLSIVTILLVIFYMLFTTVEAMAVSNSDFPVCTNPQGTLKTSYSSGSHGIVGSSAEYQGSDSVYSIDADKTMQCYCALDGRGIQTNWQKAINMTQKEIDEHVASGWIFVPTGKIWGLDDAPYIAKNQDYTCKSSDGGRGGSSDSSSSSSSGSSSTGSVLGALTLASTGNLIAILTFGTFGLVLLTAGIFLKRFK